ncbi:MAG: hypothetical protein HN578_15880 [Rhodospirillales bacterium]|jgi:hypothetical protein|nr:hypothetical protein [Alphaproteobacteria bacterium]MBT5192083.1 hypothetical protein [Rhodospirillaceae bacterium]MBT8004391.1 hypothetical protein [Rhodospirillales bacterium]
MSESLKVVAIVANAMMRNFQVDLARLLKDRHGSKVYLYTQSKNAATFMRNMMDPSPFDEIIVNPFTHPMEFPTSLDESAVIAKALEFETRYGRSINRFAIADRHFGRGFSPAGYNHPRSHQSEGSSYLQFLDSYNSFFELWEREFTEKGIRLLIDGGPREAAVARAHGAVVVVPSSTKFENLFYWTTDEFSFSSQIATDYERGTATADHRFDDVVPYSQDVINKQTSKNRKLSVLIWRLLRQVRHHIYYHLSGSAKAKRYLLRSELKLIFREWRVFKELSGGKNISLKELAKKKYVYYAMHVEPEVNFHRRSPEYFYQMSAIISIARDLPAGVIMAVKEHMPAVGRRPEQFYAQLRELKNVEIVDVREPGLEVVMRAAAVITFAGTAGHEAAIRGIPVISFGRHNLINLLPHVYVVNDEEQIAPYLHTALNEERDQAEIAGCVARFVSALRQNSFDMNELAHNNPEGVSAASSEDGYDLLMEYLAVLSREAGVYEAGNLLEGSHGKAAS